MSSPEPSKTEEPKGPRFSPPAVSLPKGFGAIKGIGERGGIEEEMGSAWRVPVDEGDLIDGG
jgi:hypothetical protein